MWFDALCPFEGPTGEGEQLHILVELNETEISNESNGNEYLSEETINRIWQRLLETEDELPKFYEHSVHKNATRPIGHISEPELQEKIASLFGPDYAIKQDGEVVSRSDS